MVDYQKAQEAIAQAKKDQFLEARPSGKIRMAVADLRACAANPKFYFNMKRWVNSYDDYCSVCLGGAVLAGRFAVFDIGSATIHEALGYAIGQAVQPLDAVRGGLLHSAAIMWGVDSLQASALLGANCISLDTHDFNSRFDWCCEELLKRADIFEMIGA